MVGIRVLSVGGVLVMAGAIAFGFASGDFTGEGAELLGLAWGKVTLVDLYVGLALFGAWVVFRERSWDRVLIWWALLVVLGNFAAALYVALAAFRSRDVDELLLGGVR